METPSLFARTTEGATVEQLPGGGWRLSIPAGPAGRYRWAQLDDYLHLARRSFLWQAPLALDVYARVSAAGLAGTWGFGLWNDPFNASLGVGGTARRLPAVPNTAWFFHASPANYLSLRDDQPASGFLAAVFSAPNLPALALLPALPALPLLAWKVTARLLRRLAGRLVRDQAARLEVDPTAWHAYRMEWHHDRVRFLVDGETVFESHLSPRGRLGLVLWIDNQYAAFPPDGHLQAGTQASPEPAWLELAGIQTGRLDSGN